MDDLRRAAAQGLERLGLGNPATLSARDIVFALDDYLARQCSAEAPKDQTSDVEELAFELGSLWGMQLIQSLQWHWIRVRFQFATGPSEVHEAIGVASMDASLVIYPFQTIYFYCVQSLPVRVARSLEVLSEPGRVPMLPPNGLVNVMHHIH